MLAIVFVIVSFIGHTMPLQQINIGALFYEEEFETEQIFKDTILRINNDHNVKFNLLPFIRHLSPFDDSIELKKKACDLIENGVYAIFGPSSKTGSDVVSVICNSTNIPHLLFDSSSVEDEGSLYNLKMTLNMYPSPSILSKAYAEIINNFGWKKFTIVYQLEKFKGYTILHDVLELYDLHNDIVRIRKFRSGDDYRVLWKDIKGERRVILDCSKGTVEKLIKTAVQFDIIGQLHHIFITNLETYNIDFTKFRDNFTRPLNITAARLSLCEGTYKNMFSLKHNLGNTQFPKLSLKSNLIHDAVILFVSALRYVTKIYKHTAPKSKCSLSEYKTTYYWDMGHYLYKAMRNLASEDRHIFRSGNVRFTEKGDRSDFNIDIYDPLNNNVAAIWDTKGQIRPQHAQMNATKQIVYTVATRIGEPYFMENVDAVAKNATGNNRYMGYAVDLIAAISKEIGFEYIFVPVADNAYGKFNKETRHWNGIIGELINNDAHMGICDLTITQARKTVVDFTVPFMQLGISILAYQKPHELKAWSSFLDPFTLDVWIYVMISIFFIASLFILMARISKREWENPHPCSRDPSILENKWNICNSFWLTVGSIMTAGSDILPRSTPMRIFNAMWWIFAVIISNSYTANLAAFLTNIKMEGSITGIEDLAGQSKIKFGTMEGGSTYTFFSESNETTYRLAYNMMQNEDPSAYTKDNKEGVERVLKNNGSYMFLMETTSLEYNTERNCKLKMLGEKFGEKHYAIAVPFGAEYRSNLSVAILKLSERGELFQLKNKWWKNHNHTCQGDLPAETSETPDMTFSEVRGIFYSLGVGALIAYTIGMIEFLIHTQAIAVKEKIPYKQAFIEDLKFFVCVWNNKKAIK